MTDALIILQQEKLRLFKRDIEKFMDDNPEFNIALTIVSDTMQADYISQFANRSDAFRIVGYLTELQQKIMEYVNSRQQKLDTPREQH